MVVIIKLSDVHYNDSEHHYFEQGYKVVVKFVVIIISKCSDDHCFKCSDSGILTV